MGSSENLSICTRNLKKNHIPFCMMLVMYDKYNRGTKALRKNDVAITYHRILQNKICLHCNGFKLWKSR